MMRVLAVIAKKTGEILEYVVLDDSRYAGLEDFLAAAREEARELSVRHGLPHAELELFDGSDRSLASFFRMFPNLKLTPRSVRSEPRTPRPD